MALKNAAMRFLKPRRYFRPEAKAALLTLSRRPLNVNGRFQGRNPELGQRTAQVGHGGRDDYHHDPAQYRGRQGRNIDHQRSDVHITSYQDIYHYPGQQF